MMRSLSDHFFYKENLLFTDIDWVPLLSFILITALSPGPNNLSSASMGVLYGYKRSFKYVMGIVVGLFMVMIVSGLISNLMLTIFPAYEATLRVIGAIYILWLAYNTLKTSYSSEGNDKPPMGFKEGFILQYLNPKVILFAMMLYTSYLRPITGDFLSLFISALALAARAFLINSTWVLFGAGIRRFLSRPVVGKAFNIFIAVMLVYNAADLLGLPDLLTKVFG